MEEIKISEILMTEMVNASMEGLGRYLCKIIGGGGGPTLFLSVD